MKKFYLVFLQSDFFSGPIRIPAKNSVAACFAARQLIIAKLFPKKSICDLKIESVEDLNPEIKSEVTDDTLTWG